MTAPAQDLATLAVCSMLHEPASPSSADRHYAGRPVLEATLIRLARCENVGGVAVVCWDDQVAAAAPCAAATGAQVIPHGPRQALPQVEAIAVARRWQDGWRGGLLRTCPTDAGFFAPTFLALARAVSADAVVLVDPASALLDPDLLDALVARAAAQSKFDHVFTPAAPGLCGVVVRRSLLEALAESKVHPGLRVHYLPEAPTIDPLTSDACFHPAAPVERTLHDFRLSSDRAVRWAESLGDVDELAAVDLVARAGPILPPASPRELTIEPTTRRHARPVWQTPVEPADLSPEPLLALVAEALEECDDLRLTLGGRGDPLLWPHLHDFVADIRKLGAKAVHVETDLLSAAPGDLEKLVAAGPDVVSINVPAMSADIYRQTMGVDRLADVLTALGRLIVLRQQADKGGKMLPILVPTLVKCRTNLTEMEAWYDQWLRAVGSAAIRGPDDVHLFSDPPAGVAVAAMSRTERRPFELRVRADATLTDNHNRPVGQLGTTTLAAAWAAANPPTPAPAHRAA